MTDATVDDVPIVEARTSKAPWRWLSGVIFALAGTAAAVAIVFQAQLGARTPTEIAAGYVALVMVACLGVWLFHAQAKQAPAWLLAPLSVMLMLVASRFVSDALFGVAAAPVALVAAFAPGCLATWARARLGLAREKAARRAVSSASVVALVQVLMLGYFSSVWSPGASYSAWVIVALIALAMAGPIAAAHAVARREKKLPLVFNAKPPYGHITSLGALTLLLFILLIAGIGLLTTIYGVNASISQNAGLSTVAGLIVAFGLVAVLPTSRRVNKALDAITETLEKSLGIVSKGFSAFDGVLVHSIAPVVGATQVKRIPRYGLLFGQLAALGWLGWLLPAPHGLFPLFAAFFGVLAVARRWAWVEEDRENAMLNRKFAGDHIRIGFSNDLRDEALLGFMSLFVIVPLALRQLHIADGGHMFVISETSSVDDVFAWVSFFGTELAKAVPFVDWAEIYQVEGAAPIGMDETHVGEAQHAVFATRVVVDLVFLAALLQAISALQRSAKLKTMFYERSIDRLDPFAEDAAFRELAVMSEGSWKLVEKIPEQFWTYDEDRLVELAGRADAPAISFVAQAIIDRNAERLPEQLLVDEAKQDPPDPEKLDLIIGRIRDERGEPDIGFLKLAHLHLNRALTRSRGTLCL
ncbi:MAG: hypothetical protein AB7U76_26095 [Pirellulales bacterium]